MGYRALVPLCMATYVRVSSFLLPATLPIRWRGHSPATSNSRVGNASDPPASDEFLDSSISLSRRNWQAYTHRRLSSRFRSSAVVSQQASTVGGPAPSPSMFNENEAVSCFRNADKGSDVWLVGLCHRAKPSVELVEDVIREVKPQVVMVELDAYRSRLLPPGEVYKSENGLCWWRANEKQGPVEKPKARQKNAKPSTERGEQGVEFYTAAVEAQACGAQVLLGDRDFEEILRRQAEAKRADEKQAAKSSEKRRKAGLDMNKLEGLIARRSALGQEVPVTREIMRKWGATMKRLRPKEHTANVTERDEVMSRNLMRVKEDRTTVAVVGFGHLDGIERILEANGWKLQ